MNKRMHYEETMDSQNTFHTLAAGMIGLVLGILMARPKHIPEALIALIAGLFACVVLAPAVAEICTSLSTSFTSLSWLKATEDTALYNGIVGICAVLGFQIATALKEHLLSFFGGLIRRKVDGNSRSRKR